MSIRKNDYRKAAQERLIDAQKLREAKRYHTMVYLLGFVMECALAYGYCEKNQAQRLDDVRGYDESVWEDHNRLTDKLKAAGMDVLLDDLNKLKGDWHVKMRYQGNKYIDDRSKAKAEEIYQATLRVYKRIQQLSL